MSAEGKHLTIEQIEHLLEIQSGTAKNLTKQSLDEARLHLVGCGNCQKLVSTEEARQQILRNLKQEFPASTSEDCPPEIRFYELAAGVLEHRDSDALVKHSTECDRCGPILRRVSEQLTTVQTDQETEVLASLITSQPEWQERFGRMLASATRAEVNVTGTLSARMNARWGFAKMVWMFGALAMIVISVFAIVAIRKSQPKYADTLLATAYTERRTIELRIPGGAQAPLRITRGSQTSSVDKPPALLEAENLIATHLRAGSPNVNWLQAKVRADLLDGNYDSAVRTAEQAVDLEPNSASLLNDLGSAYFERAETEKSALDYGRAYDSLSRSLSKRSDDPVVLFNRAVVAERAHLYAEAENDWKRYLLIEADPAWQSEARNRLMQLDQKLREYKDKGQQLLDGPDVVTEALSSRKQQRVDQIDSAADEYLSLAVEEWIPQLTSDRLLDKNRLHSLRTALAMLGEELRTRHGDAWLSEFLSDPSYPRVSKAMKSLVRAIRANTEGDHESAIRFATIAEAEFLSAGSDPGRLRAAFETIYSNRLAAHGKACHDKSKSLIDEAHKRSYVWIEIQARLEGAACSVEISSIDESVARSRKALELARLSKYRNLELRAIVFAADLSDNAGDRLNLVNEGLAAFWSGRYELMRGYSLYTVIDSSADDLHLWFWDKAAIEEALRLIETDPDLALRGLIEYRLVRADLAIGEIDEAQRKSAEGRALLQGSASQTLVTGAFIDLAEAFVMKGRYHEALDLLASAEPNLTGFTQDVVLAKFYSARAAALLGDGQTIDGQNALSTALQLANKGISSISDERDRYAWLQTFEPAYKSLAYLDFETDVGASFSWWETFKGGAIQNAHAKEQPNSTITGRALPSFGSWSNDGTLLLSYAGFPQGIAVWIYDGKQVHGRWLSASTSEIESLAHRFYEGCADRNSDPNVLLIQGRKLYDLLIQPTKEWVQGRSRLIIETDNSLQSIPFEALVDKQGKYLADSYEIEYSPGIFYLARDQRPVRIGHESHALVIGESLPDLQDGLPPLPGALDEAREVAGRFDKPLLLLDHDARLPHILQELPQTEVFHFAGHAIGNRQFSGLLLASSQGDDSISSFDVNKFNSQLLNQTRLMVLSACSTATGTGNGLNDRDSFARSALAAGVPNVVASRWSVDSIATREWMTFFYENAIAGESVGSAAKRARFGLKAKSERGHPFYWAAFSVFVSETKSQNTGAF